MQTPAPFRNTAAAPECGATASSANSLSLWHRLRKPPRRSRPARPRGANAGRSTSSARILPASPSPFPRHRIPPPRAAALPRPRPPSNPRGASRGRSCRSPSNWHRTRRASIRRTPRRPESPWRGGGARRERMVRGRRTRGRGRGCPRGAGVRRRGGGGRCGGGRA
ncbi:hypothetical protein DFJ74DRAFT_748045, partial [Hyaloraphidium curvatum]